MRRKVYNNYHFKDGFKDSFSWGIIEGKYRIETGEKLNDFLNLFIYRSSTFKNIKVTKKELKFKKKILEAIVSDVIYSCMDETLEVFRDFFWLINNRTAHSEIMQEILLNSPEEFNNEINSMVPDIFSKEEVDEKWLDMSNDLYFTIPKIASSIYIYALKYVGDSAFYTIDRTPLIFKKRELPLLSKSKKFSSQNEKYKQIQKEMNALFNLLNSKNLINNAAFNLYLLNDKTNLVDLFLSTVRIKENGRYKIGGLSKGDLEFYFEELVPLINIKGAYLKILILTKIDYLNEFMKDIEFWEIYKILFDDLKESLLELVNLEFKNELTHLPEKIRVPYGLYLSFKGFNTSQFDHFIITLEEEQINNEILFFNENTKDSKMKVLSNAFEYAHDIYAKSTKSYRKIKEGKDFIMSEHPLFKNK